MNTSSPKTDEEERPTLTGCGEDSSTDLASSDATEAISEQDQDDFDLTDFDSVSVIVHGSVPDDITGSATEIILQKRDLVFRILFDGGVHQSRKHNNWKHADTISGADIIVTTHPHVDHVALIPRLLRDLNTRQVMIPESAIHSSNIAILDTLRIVTRKHFSSKKSCDNERSYQLNKIASIEGEFRYRGRFHSDDRKTRTDHKNRRLEARKEVEAIEDELAEVWKGEYKNEKWVFPKLSKNARKPRDRKMTELARIKALLSPKDETLYYDDKIDTFIGMMEHGSIMLDTVLDEYNSIYNEEYIKTGLDDRKVIDIPSGNSKHDISVRQSIFQIYRDFVNQAFDARIGNIEEDCLITSEDVETFRRKSVSIPEEEEVVITDDTEKLTIDEMNSFIEEMESVGVSLQDVVKEYNRRQREESDDTGVDYTEITNIPTSNSKEDLYTRETIFMIYNEMISGADHLGDASATKKKVKKSKRKSVDIPKNSTLAVGGDIAKFSFHKTGHLEKGSSAARLQVKVGGKIQSILVTGDIGRTDLPDYYPDVDVPGEKSDVIIQEATYGDRDHISYEESRELFFQSLDSAIKSGGHVFMPVLSMERSFRLFQDLKRAIEDGRLNPSDLKICYNGGQTLLNKYLQPFLHGEEGREIKKLIHEATGEDTESMLKKSSKKKGNVCKILLASGGFVPPGSTANRMMTQLINSRAPIHIVSTSYHGAEGSPGHNLFQGRVFTDVYGADYELPDNFKTYAIGGFSGHAGQKDLVDYNLAAGHTDTTTYLVHGETKPREALQEELEKNGRTAKLPTRAEEIVLFGDT